jgi:fatty-acyl-CoA synthase
MAQAPTTRDSLRFHAAFRPEAIACIDLAANKRLSYADFDQRVSACAAGLAARLGEVSGERVAVIARNSAEQAILAMACERAGAIFAPLNWRLTAPEIAQLLADCTPAIIASDSEFEAATRDAIKEAKAPASLVRVQELANTNGAADLPPVPQDAPCILLYTSGTTGRPKGVVITRDNVLFSCLNFTALASVGPNSRLLCDAPLFHTVGLMAITRTALHQGACVVLSDRFVPSATLERLSDAALGITHYFVVPQMIEALMREPTAGRADFSRLVALFSGGGPLNPDLITGLAARGVMLINGFGMSEIGSAIHMPLDADLIARFPHAVGFPAPHMDVKLAGPDSNEVADGGVGEIWIRGPSVSPGYWRQEEATRASRSGEWFRSGDLARREQNGAYVLIDRLKDMYISGGENVYPAEVEAVLRQATGVKDAAIIGVPDKRWGEVGIAFIEANATPPSEQDLRAWCAGRLARFKQPAHIRFVKELPRTGSGKIRKDLLRNSFAASLSGNAHAN